MNESRLRIYILFEQSSDLEPHGCGYIRLLSPLSHPVPSISWDISHGLELPDRHLDVIILERLWKPGRISLTIAEHLVRNVRKRGTTLIYTLDDNLIDLNLDNSDCEFPSQEQRMIVRFFSREADGIIVSTETLKKRLQRLNRNIRVVPNALDERLFPYREEPLPVRCKKGGPLRFGYMGTCTHTSDLMMLSESLRVFLREQAGNVEFELVGVTTNSRIMNLFEGLPVRMLRPHNKTAYPRFIKWAAKHLQWDFAIAPLEENKFNSAKSDIKYLDYAMLGIPAIYSDVDIYQASLAHGETGLLCKNSPEAWLAALRLICTDNSLRDRIRTNAFSYALQNRTLRHRATDWFQAIAGIVKQKPSNHSRL